MLLRGSSSLRSLLFLTALTLWKLNYLISNYPLLIILFLRLIENIGTLASIYTKPPEQFVKKLRESQNQRELEELDENGDYVPEDYVDSSGQKIGEYQPQIKQNEYESALKNKGKNYTLLSFIE
jgi:hypothetical protein